MSKRKQLIKKQEQDGFEMNERNLKICLDNQDRYFTPELNDVLELHYYGFHQIDNLEPFTNLNTLYLQNNIIEKIQNISHLKKLVTLNLSNNRIKQISGLEELTELSLLDLSNNKIAHVSGLQSNSKLTLLNLSNNLLEKPESIEQLQHNKMLGCLHLSNNPLPNDAQLFKYLQKLSVKTLYMKQTKFSRGTNNYRKQTIYHVKNLTFLDDRPVTEQQRLLVEAWKQGGIVRQNEVRKQIQISKEEKNKKTIEQIMQRSQKIQKMRDQLFEKLSVEQRKQLQELKKCLNEEKEEADKKLITLKVEELEKYLKLWREDVNYMGVGQMPQVPTNLCERHEPQAIYIYGVSDEQLPKIKQKYYPEEQKPLIARPFKKDQQVRWVKTYTEILNDLMQESEYRENKQLLLTVFNMKIHRLDENSMRKARRFKMEELMKQLEQCQMSGEQLNQLD